MRNRMRFSRKTHLQLGGIAIVSGVAFLLLGGNPFHILHSPHSSLIALALSWLIFAIVIVSQYIKNNR